jgi:hypothetical protein
VDRGDDGADAVRGEPRLQLAGKLGGQHLAGKSRSVREAGGGDWAIVMGLYLYLTWETTHRQALTSRFNCYSKLRDGHDERRS